MLAVAGGTDQEGSLRLAGEDFLCGVPADRQVPVVAITVGQPIVARHRRDAGNA